MQRTAEIIERRTSADVVYDYLYEEIVSLAMLPGAKISEVEIANRFGVSRQPVRDAFSRLGNHGLLLIRPQKATVVKKFSLAAISSARFVRTAVEVEVLRLAARNWDGSVEAQIRTNLDQQMEAVRAEDTERFHALDYEFHRTMCIAAQAGFAFDTIAENKAQVDRLCVLSLNEVDSMQVLFDDHSEIVESLVDRDEVRVEKAIRLHLSRLDDTVQEIRRNHSEYFDD